MPALRGDGDGDVKNGTECEHLKRWDLTFLVNPKALSSFSDRPSHTCVRVLTVRLTVPSGVQSKMLMLERTSRPGGFTPWPVSVGGQTQT